MKELSSSSFHLSYFFLPFLDLLCPPTCVFCGASMPESATESACDACIDKMVTPAGHFCLRCGGRRYQRLQGGEGCTRCRTTDFRFRRAIVLGEYEQELRKAVLRMKTDRDGLRARAAADLLILHRRTELLEAKADFVIPVPMHRSRRWQRGVNSPDILAGQLAEFLKRPALPQLVKRVRSTDLQYLLSRQNRQTNVENAFELTKQRTKIEGKNALLVDDILTTGATCNEIAKLLRRAGMREIAVCALARAEGRYTKE